MIAKQFLLSAAKDQKALTSSKLQFIDATVKSELFVHKGNYLYRDAGNSTCIFAIIIFLYVTTLLQSYPNLWTRGLPGHRMVSCLGVCEDITWLSISLLSETDLVHCSSLM